MTPWCPPAVGALANSRTDSGIATVAAMPEEPTSVTLRLLVNEYGRVVACHGPSFMRLRDVLLRQPLHRLLGRRLTELTGARAAMPCWFSMPSRASVRVLAWAEEPSLLARSWVSISEVGQEGWVHGLHRLS